VSVIFLRVAAVALIPVFVIGSIILVPAGFLLPLFMISAILGAIWWDTSKHREGIQTIEDYANLAKRDRDYS
jgi:hypothetical protein